MKKVTKDSSLRKDEVITQDNVVRIGERIALRALKTVLCHSSYNHKLQSHYMGFPENIANVNNPEHVFYNGYVLAQCAACFLCEYMGMRLDEVCAYTVIGKQTKILDVCFSRINQMLMQQRKDSYVLASNDCPEVIKLSVPFQEEVAPEEDYT